MNVDASWYDRRRVFITGHTGFKGAWLSAWLARAGAEVTGYGLAPPPGAPSLFAEARVGEGIRSIIGDIRDRSRLDDQLRASTPEIVFHLAAQPLVRRSYRAPIDTYEINVMGTVHVLDAVRRIPSVRAVVVVTSDKCYEHRPLDRPYREDDPLGGHDPYSSSKGCAELVVSAMRRSFFDGDGCCVGSARAGNVIGGGDWSEDRLVPDVMVAAARGATASIRNPDAVRPWQFVLEPLRGYLMLGRRLVESGGAFAEAWNFGPADQGVAVRALVERLHTGWDRVSVLEEASDSSSLHEATQLRIDSTKAAERLGWRPLLSLEEAVDMTVSWYRRHFEGTTVATELVAGQLTDYEGRALGPS
ncbi:MAG: CDP-glucose 4,6-dehydratase [Acidimicrobiales bacterium]